MLFNAIVRETTAFGQGYLNCGTSGLAKGCFVKMDGVFSADSGPSGKEGKPGYAKAGSIKFSPLTSGALSDTTNTSVGIMQKYEYQREGSDISLDSVVSGESIIVYFDGFFHTDQYDTSITWTSVTPGTTLYVNNSSVVTTGGLINAIPRARFWGVASGYDSYYTSRALLFIEVLPVRLDKKPDSL